MPGGVSEGVNAGVIEGVNDTVADTIRDTVNDTLRNDVFAGVSESVEARLIKLIHLLYRQPMLKVADLSPALGVSIRTIKDDLKRLSDKGTVHYEGSKKTGGYLLIQELHNKLHDKRD